MRIVTALMTIAMFLAGPALGQELLGGRGTNASTTLEMNFDRPGADMFARSIPGGDVGDCQALCRATSGCAAFTFDKLDGLQAPVCRIKDSAPPQVSAPCCISGIVTPDAALAATEPPKPAPAAAPEAAAAPPHPLSFGPAPPPWPAGATGLRLGTGLCVEAPAAAGQDGAAVLPARTAVCAARAEQAIRLDGGVLRVAGAPGGALVPVGRDGVVGCRSWTATSARRRYDLRVCRTADAETPHMVVADGPNAVSIESHAGIADLDFAPGAPLTVAAEGSSSASAPLWEAVAATGQIRLMGTGLCVVAPMDDDTPGAPLYLDYCLAPISRWDGARSGPDGHSRFEPFTAPQR